MNILRKVWSPKSKINSRGNNKENVTLVNIIQFNNSCIPKRNTWSPTCKNVLIDFNDRVSLHIQTNINDFDHLIEQYNDCETPPISKRKSIVKIIPRKKSSAITISDLEIHKRKTIDLIPLKKVSQLSKQKISHSRCLRSRSAMATVKYKDPEFVNRRARSAISVYLLDHLMESKRIEFLENMYGGKFVSHRSAKIIQRCFRNYKALKMTKIIASNLLIPSNQNRADEKIDEIPINDTRVSEFSFDSVDLESSISVVDDPFDIHNDKERMRLYYLGKNLFNRNCNKGINFLIKNGILESEAESIVKFLNSKGLSSYAKGDYMSQDKNKLAISTRREFIMKMSFHNCSIESGVRKLFSQIRIPGETQKILNMLEEFSSVYLSQNIDIKNQLKKDDTVVLIAFAILMVHTSLYNPSAAKQDKMTKENFIRIFKGINEEEFVNEVYLSELYDNVKKKQMKPLSDHTDVVRNVYSSLTGPILPKDLIQNHRKLICQYDCKEIPNLNKKPNSHSHSRAIFLFNDLILITKKAKSHLEFHVRHVIRLLGLQFNQFSTEYYKNGLELIQIGQKKPIFYLDCISSNNREKLKTDLLLYIEEVNQLDKFRAGEEIEKFNKINDKR